MVAISLIQNTLEELGGITKTEYLVFDDSARLLASTKEELEIDVNEIHKFIASPADSQLITDYYYQKVKGDDECVYVVVAFGGNDNGVMGKVLACQIKTLMSLGKEKLDKAGFFQNLILDNMLLVDIHNRAAKLHIENDVKRLVYIIESKSDKDGIAVEVLKSLFVPQAGNTIISVDEQSIILIKDLVGKYNRDDIEEIAEEILDVLNTEAMLRVRVSYGLVVNELKDISKSYKEAKMALDVGSIFYSTKEVLSYENLGIGRLIYQLPINLCEMFVKEVFGDTLPTEIDEEILQTVYKFFENNLNVSETSRQLYVHRNTLVYRMEKLQREIGLDMRVFEDALTFKIAMMVVDYIGYLQEKDKIE